MLIIGICVVFAVVIGKGKPTHPIFGDWVCEENGNKMSIIEGHITINGLSREYNFEEDNIIAIAINGEFYKIVYKLEDGLLYIMVPDASGEVTTLIYERKKE